MRNQKRKICSPPMNQGWLRSLGEQIGAARRSARVSQATLAKYAGITRPHLSDYERGRVKTPKAEVLARISERLNCRLTLNGVSLGPEQLIPLGRFKPEPAVQLNFPFEMAQNAMKVLKAVQKGATLTMEKRRGRLVFRATFQPSRRTA